MNPQYIINFDIENSRIYDILPEFLDWKAIPPEILKDLKRDWAEIRAGIAHAIGQKETRFIAEENLENAMGMLHRLNTAAQLENEFVLVPMTHKYLSNYIIYQCGETIPDKSIIQNVPRGTMENFGGEYISSYFAYTPADDMKIMEKIIGLWKSGADILFCAHNFAYEYRYISQNCRQFFKLLLDSADDHKIIADKSTTIKSIEFVWGDKEFENGVFKIKNPHKFVIHDTWLIAGMRSIKNLGASFGIPKLEYEYDKTRICKEDLNEHDFAYNQRDNEIALLFLLDMMKQNPDYMDITKIPMSATQHYKNECKRDPEINARKISRGKEITLSWEHKRLAHTYNMQTAYLYSAFFNASGGGIVGVNPETTLQWFPDCHSFDISSAHPSQIYNRRFPNGSRTRRCKPEEYTEILEGLQAAAEFLHEDPKTLYNYYQPNKDYLIHAVLHDVCEKHLENGNVINCLGSGAVTVDNTDFTIEGITSSRQAQTRSYIKREQDVKGEYFKYGKVRKCKSYAKWFYGIDLIYILSFYDCTVEITECYEYPLQNVDQYTLNQFNKYAALKAEYKDFVKVAKADGFAAVAEKIHDSPIAQDYTRESLQAHKADYVEFLQQELLRIKGCFNGLFGVQYQNFCFSEMDFDEGLNIINTGKTLDYKESLNNTSVLYCVGAYIAAWSRFELAAMIHHAINAGGLCLYWATDSIKCANVPENIFEDWYSELKKYSTFGKYNKWDFGAVDCETKGHPCNIYVIETLKYLAVTFNNNKSVLDKIGKRIDIKYTISGFQAGVYLHDILSEWCVQLDGEKIRSEGKPYTPENVREIQKILAHEFRPHIIEPDRTGKLAPDYSYLGYATPLGQVNFAPLVSMPYNLGNFKIGYKK